MNIRDIYVYSIENGRNTGKSAIICKEIVINFKYDHVNYI